jgi:hypothetical protein
MDIVIESLIQKNTLYTEEFDNLFIE